MQRSFLAATLVVLACWGLAPGSVLVDFEGTDDAALFPGTGTLSRVTGHGGYVAKLSTGNGAQCRKYSPGGVDYLMGAGTISTDVNVYYHGGYPTASYSGGLMLHALTPRGQQYYARLNVNPGSGTVTLMVGNYTSSGHTAAVSVPAGTFTPVTSGYGDIGWYNLSAQVSSDASGNYVAVVTATAPDGTEYTATYVDSGSARYTSTGLVGFYGYCQWNAYILYDNFRIEPTPPNGVTDLTVAGVDWNKVTLQWTAPSDSMYGPVARYDLRYSTTPITDEASFEAATPLTAPTPADPGTVQTFTFGEASPTTTYSFAIKCYNAGGLASPLSNIVTATTPEMDAVPPAAISDLAATTVKPNYVVLTWTAVGDDGMTGNAAGYDLRYATTPIVDDASFEAATPVTSLAAPLAPGSAETVSIHGLSPATAYHFAIRAYDEVPNVAPISNVLPVQTLEDDPYPPAAVSDLSVTAMHIHTAYLSWTAPADIGSAGLAGYDIRYSTSPIDEINWETATQVSGEPVPAAAGTAETFAVSGLDAETVYYFAIKSVDDAEPANVSALSNVTSGKTMPPVLPVTVRNPWLVNDRVADTHNIATMGATYVNAYTPDGVIPPSSDEEKAINIYNNQKRRLYHWADEPPNGLGTNIDDPTYTQNVFGWALCGRHAAQACTIVNAAGLTPRRIGLPGHWVYEVYYDGGWHFFDTMTTCYVYNRANPRKVASCDEIKADSSLVLNAVAEGRACPGFLLCGDTPSWFADVMKSYSPSGSGVVTTKWTGDMDLRIGEAFTRTWESWANQHPTPKTDADSIKPTLDPPYHHEASKDWKDTVNLPYWEPYSISSAYSSTLPIPMNPTYRRWSNGTYVLAPDFTSEAYKAALDATSSNLASITDDGLAPSLHAAAANSTANAVFKISLPYYLTDATISGSFYRKTASDVCKIYVSTNGTSWTSVWTHNDTGMIEVTNLSLRTSVFGKFAYWVKVELKGAAAKNDAGVESLVINTIFQHNKGAMAYLDKGVNNITLTFDNPDELQASRNMIHVYYKWKEFDGTDWTIDRHFEGYYAASPSSFTIVTGGAKVPRTEYILLEVVPPVVDPTPPGQITDLAAGTPTAGTVPLTWTATGDNGAEGAAMAYDLRYSTSPIVDEASFAAATPVLGVPAPKAAGSPESFTVTYLAGNTTYYFAIKAVDKGANSSPLSNVVSATTLEQQRITDLAAGAPTAARVSLTWTAIDDGSGGAYASYDLRYSTSPIVDEVSFAAATPVTGLPAPKPAGSAESFTVLYLQGNTTYYFALKGINVRGGSSPLSNVATATTLEPQRITDLAAGVAGSNKVPLTWTAIDDGSLGTYASYDLRYSTSPITDDVSFAAATPVTGLPAPQAPGSAESFVVTGLQALTTYHFAIKAIDAMGRPSPLSNAVAATTTEPDLVAPQWVGTLVGKPSATAGGVDLTWTAPADHGPNGAGPFTCTSYQLRYSTSPIRHDDNDATWDSATAVTGLPAPQAPGTMESFTVSGLTGGEVYYFAIKAVDDSGNVSEVSNSAPATASVLGELVLQNGLNGYNGCLDSYIDRTSTNFGTNERMTVCGYGIGNEQRGLVKFDLSGLAGTTITKATLYLWSYDEAQRKGSTGFYGAYRLTTDWVYNQCNWTKASSTVSWTTGGGDFEAEPDGTSPKFGYAKVWYPFDVTARVQAWIADGSDNYGWLIKCTDETLSNQDRFYQSSTGNTQYRPKLVISDLPEEILGDIDRDGHVNVFDVFMIAESWNTALGQRGYDPRCDLDEDGFVNVFDIFVLAENWNR